jgi:hypothetical protein
MKPNLNLFSRPLFLLCLLLLITNDFYFKYAFPGLITGKLSDFAGLFIFPYFFSVFMEKQAKFIYISTALFFVYWKLEISQPFIDGINSIFHSSFYRTVDVTDLIVLLILPLSYKYLRKDEVHTLKVNHLTQMAIILISAFSFVATTLPKETPVESTLKSGKAYMVPVTTRKLKKEHTEFRDANTVYDYFSIPEYNATIYIKFEIKEYDRENTIIILKEILRIEIGGVVQQNEKTEKPNLPSGLTIKDFENYYKKHLTKKYGSARTLKSGL